MGLESLVHLLVVLVIVGAIAWVAHWVITHYFPEPVRTPALIILLVLLLRWAGVAGLKV